MRTGYYKQNHSDLFYGHYLFIVLSFIAGYTIHIYSIDATSQLLLKLTFVVISLPVFAFVLGVIQKKSLSWIFVVYTLINILAISWLAFIILPKVSEFDDIKKAANIILEDINNHEYTMIHYHGIQPSLLVRLNKNVAQLRSIEAVNQLLTVDTPVYILANKKYLDKLSTLSKTNSKQWDVGDSIILKFLP